MKLIPADSIFSGRDLRRGERIAIAIPVAIAAAIAALIAFQLVPDMVARDFTYPWRGARALLAGENPFDVIRPTGPPPDDHWFMYPLTAPVAVIPLSFLPAQLAGALFSGLGAGLLAFGLTGSGGLHSLVLLLSPSFGFAVVLGQWTPLLIAGALAAPLHWSLACKPTIGLPLFLYRPRWQIIMQGALLVMLTLIIQPTWPLDWWRNTRMLEGHVLPLLRPFGFIGLLAALRWRRPEARLVTGMTLVPQNMYFYDQLPLILAGTTARRRLLLVLLAWLAWWLGTIGCETPWYCGQESEIWVILLLFAPATALALFSAEDVRSLLARYRSR